MQDEIEAEMIRGPAIKGTIDIDGETKPFYIKMASPAVHEDLRNRFYHTYDRFAPMPSMLTDQEYTINGISITYGFYSDNEEFLNRRRAALIAWSTQQIFSDVGLLTTVDLNDKLASEQNKKSVTVYTRTSVKPKPGKRWAKPGRLK